MIHHKRSFHVPLLSSTSSADTQRIWLTAPGCMEYDIRSIAERETTNVMLSMADSKTLPNRLDVLQPSMQAQRKASSLSVPWVSRTMSCACLNLTKTNPRLYPRHSVIRTRFGISARVLPMKHYSLPAIAQVSNDFLPHALAVGADMIYVYIKWEVILPTKRRRYGNNNIKTRHSKSSSRLIMQASLGKRMTKVIVFMVFIIGSLCSVFWDNKDVSKIMAINASNVFISSIRDNVADVSHPQGKVTMSLN